LPRWREAIPVWSWGIERLASPWAAVPPDVVGPVDAVVVHAASILNPHHTTAMAATMQAAVRARSRTWIFIVSIPFSSLPRVEGM
jgi:hypothetical protein